MSFRAGIGYDIHRLVKGRRLVLGGVNIPYPKGLLGHSDADVLVHAVCDALLGAMGKGDIGELFPDTDKKYKNISSLKLLTEVYGLVKKNCFKIRNIDTMILIEKPHLKAFKPKMRGTIAKTLGLSPKAVNIKATTQEGLGFGAKKEAIAAFATVILKKG